MILMLLNQKFESYILKVRKSPTDILFINAEIIVKFELLRKNRSLFPEVSLINKLVMLIGTLLQKEIKP